MKVRQNLSSEALFHFVTNREYLVDILKNGFQPRYSLELLPIPEKNIPIGILMKCFCDIPLGLIKKHLSSYGKYGIGISKDFSKKNGISPVLYVHDVSKTSRGYLLDIKKTAQGTPKGSLLPYMKKYEEFEGKKKIRYYDEREWRYIPDTKDIFVRSEDGITKDEFMKRINKINLDLPLNNNRLKIDFEDIRYIFVEQDADVVPVIKIIKKLKKYSDNEKDLLISKIITSTQIEEDF